uniref:Uncharacterized protein n=1 Tax=Hanusia phi TaxID=3032 RepID=A0A7S0F2N6_9CRYP|mmetsp:Transcript_36334/g.81899  ORF Transcript_36334/g.81899 Transcript_36334/m.81899 type:complete len:193 (+) Transcript_36334:92-670(+)
MQMLRWAAGLACMASCLFVIVISSCRTNEVHLLFQRLKLFKVEVKAPPSCCGSTPSYSSPASPSVQMSDGGTQQINMVGFTNKGMGYIQYRGWRHDDERDEDGAIEEEELHGGKKSQTHHRVNLARLRHLRHRRASKEQDQKMERLKSRVKEDDKEIASLKGELWTLSSSILPRIEDEVSELRKQVKHIKSK